MSFRPTKGQSTINKLPTVNKKIPTERTSKEPNTIKTDNIMCTIVTNIDLMSKTYTDQMGKFLTTSSRGNQYIY